MSSPINVATAVSAAPPLLIVLIPRHGIAWIIQRWVF